MTMPLLDKVNALLKQAIDKHNTLCHEIFAMTGENIGTRYHRDVETLQQGLVTMDVLYSDISRLETTLTFARIEVNRRGEMLNTSAKEANERINLLAKALKLEVPE